MSASLDDMEPYEIFQQELDNFAKDYEKELIKSEIKNKVLSDLNIIHSFIEFVCFHKALDDFNDITPDLITSEFPEFRAFKEEDQRTLTEPIVKFIVFIKIKFGKGNEGLIDNLKKGKK